MSGPKGRALVDKRLYLPQEWIWGRGPLRGGLITGNGGQRTDGGTVSKTDRLALEMVEEGQARGYGSSAQ